MSKFISSYSRINFQSVL